jgi:hypothetical protein
MLCFELQTFPHFASIFFFYSEYVWRLLTSANKESHFFFRSFGLLHCRKNLGRCWETVGRVRKGECLAGNANV